MTGRDPASLAQFARQALERGEEAEAAPLLAEAAALARDNPLLGDWSAALYCARHRYEEALEAFARATALAPGDLRLAYARAMATLEAGRDALPLFEAAARIDSFNGDVMLGTAAAHFAAGNGAQGIADLDSVLERSPVWIEGHRGLARLRCLMGDSAGMRGTLDRALASHPGEL